MSDIRSRPSLAGRDERPYPGPTAGTSRTVTGSFPFLIVVTLFVTSLITANTVAVKILEFGPWITDADC